MPGLSSCRLSRKVVNFQLTLVRTIGGQVIEWDSTGSDAAPQRDLNRMAILIAALLMAALLTACGGSGSGGGVPATTRPIPRDGSTRPIPQDGSTIETFEAPTSDTTTPTSASSESSTSAG
jgi:hypothetical protein